MNDPKTFTILINPYPISEYNTFNLTLDSFRVGSTMSYYSGSTMGDMSAKTMDELGILSSFTNKSNVFSLYGDDDPNYDLVSNLFVHNYHKGFLMNNYSGSTMNDMSVKTMDELGIQEIIN
jgi:hypothetical protein